MTRSTHPLLALLAAAFAVLALAACGSDSSGDSSTSSASSDEEKAMAFQNCLKESGVDIEVSADGGLMMRTRVGRPSSGSDGPDDIGPAMDDCREKTGWAPRPPSEEQRAEMRDRALAFAQCMRENGVDVPDPAADGRMTMRIEGNRAAFERASEECGGPGGAAAFPTAPATPAP